MLVFCLSYWWLVEFFCTKTYQQLNAPRQGKVRVAVTQWAMARSNTFLDSQDSERDSPRAIILSVSIRMGGPGVARIG